MSFEYHLSADRRERGLRLRPSKCLHLYHYALHPLFGFFGARLQTWFPFNIQIWVNGREWLVRQLQKAGHSDFRRHDNCFTALGQPRLGPAPDGPSAQDRLETRPRRHRPNAQPLHGEHLQALAAELLLVGLSERMGH